MLTGVEIQMFSSGSFHFTTSVLEIEQEGEVDLEWERWTTVALTRDNSSVTVSPQAAVTTHSDTDGN